MNALRWVFLALATGHWLFAGFAFWTKDWNWGAGLLIGAGLCLLLAHVAHLQGRRWRSPLLTSPEQGKTP